MTEFEYTVEDGQPVTVAANAAGVATATFTPTSAGSYTMRVRGRTAEACGPTRRATTSWSTT
ncbi:hypothetical protein V2I01_16710 [Micromonospora sp. BRA006-A]|nr:hypothetical protein [Micromonospora sp. BRA006-A]